MKAVAGILVVVCVAGIAWLGWALFGCGCESAQIPRVDGDLHSIGSALEAYRAAAGHYPTTEQGLMALVEQPATQPLPLRWQKGMESMPLDPWKGEYRYRLLPEGDGWKFEVKSAGPDGQLGTKDDLSSLDPVE